MITYHTSVLTRVILVCSPSAGGIGVILNLDRVANNLAKLGSRVQVRGLADSGWYLDLNSHAGGRIDTIKKGMRWVWGPLF